MQCKICKNSIECTYSIVSEEKDRPIEITYQWWICKSCGAKYFGVLEDSKVNIFDDTLLHEGYLVDEIKWQECLKLAKKCPQPRNVNCNCEFHKDLPPSDFFGEPAWYSNE